MRPLAYYIPFRIFIMAIVLLLVASLSSCNVLMYKCRPFYTERSMLMPDTMFTLYQYASYNRHVVDEQRDYYLELHFSDTAKAKIKGVLNLATDTAIVRAAYGLRSIWNWTDEKNKISGWIKILEWNATKVVLKERVEVNDIRRVENKRFYGTRAYTIGVKSDTVLVAIKKR